MIAWLEHILRTGVEHYGLLAVYLTMTLESACIPLPSEVVMPWAGYLAAQGHFSLPAAAVVGALANLTGSWLAYAAGRFGGRAFVDHYGSYIFLSKRHLHQANRWFARRGELTVFVSRMLPGIRTFISLPAGIAKMNFFRFSLFSLAGALPWNLALVYLGYSFSNNWGRLLAYLRDFNVLVFGGLGLAAVLYLLWRKKPWRNKVGRKPVPGQTVRKPRETQNL